MGEFWQVIGALTPPIGVGVIFYVIMRLVMRADRNERIAQEKLDLEADQMIALESK